MPEAPQPKTIAAPFPSFPALQDQINVLIRQMNTVRQQQDTTYHSLLDLMKLLRELCENTRRKMPEDIGYTLTTEAQAIYTKGYRHVMLWSPTSSQSVSIDPPQSQPTTATLDAGWNVLDVPDGTRIYVSSGTVNALLRLTDDEPSGKEF